MRGGTSYRTDDGALAFVFSYAETQVPRYYAVTMKKRNKGVHRIQSALLPTRLTEWEAQRDLDRYAKANGWEVAYRKEN